MAINVYRVVYHYEKSNQMIPPGHLTDHIASAAGDPTSLTTILNNNGKGAPSGAVIKFDSISNTHTPSALT